MDNWYRALCAPASSAAWNGNYDPAYMPQQMALTTGFMCIVGCEANDMEPSADAMGALSADPAAARDGLCAAFPWTLEDYPRFAGANTTAELAALAAPLLTKPCGCSGTAPPASWY